ncbi:MAG: hypothetical protein G01um10148_981 [Parcubacteria group bacterium Gr01-1014_8]|nr:MAG: hypothetical protein G01um10148_981 [Parcubacteria group bacterium Gr01-1014_8]
MHKKFIELLNIPDPKILEPKKVGPKRLQMVNFARTLSRGTLESPHEHKIWKVRAYWIGFQKPGIETAADAETNYKDGTVAPNPDDMKPTIWKSNKIIKAPASFEEIFHVFERLLRNDEENVLELLAAILYRDAYLLDYEISDQPNAVPEYRLSQDILQELEKPLFSVTGLPAEVYLKYLQMIAWNEDVKYNALGYNIAKEKTGRQGNLLTYTHLIAVLLGRARLANFCYAFARSGGVAPITGIATWAAFPWLRNEK